MLDIVNLISPTSLRILRFLLSDPLGQYHEREVVRKTGVSAGATNQMLRSFAQLELLSREKRGRMFFYRANMENPLVKQFKILLTLFEIERLIIQARPLADRVVMFGSCAGGTDIKESDIDLAFLTHEKAEVASSVRRFSSSRRIAPIILDPPGFSKLRRDDKALYDRISKGIVLWQRD